MIVALPRIRASMIAGSRGRHLGDLNGTDRDLQLLGEKHALGRGDGTRTCANTPLDNVTVTVYIPDMGERLGIEDLAELGGVTRRTVRYYVQEGLLPAPLGVGRGRHYGPEHLERLLHVKALQEDGLPLSEIRRRLG